VAVMHPGFVQEDCEQFAVVGSEVAVDLCQCAQKNGMRLETTAAVAGSRTWTE